NDPQFIQIKFTIYNVILAAIVTYDFSYKKLWLHTLLQNLGDIPEHVSSRKAKVVIGYFIALALSNEWLRHHYNIDKWFKFKLGCTIVFSALLIVYLMMSLKSYLKR
ncbi:MAG: septation protein IspZ, partial [Pseudomonadota bacterium]